MNCIKCGRETGEDQIFCAKCQELMAQHPVKPDVVVKLPVRQETYPKRNLPRKKARTPEEQLLRLKRTNRWLTAIVCLLLLVSVILTFFSVDIIRQLDMQRFLGQNYSTVETTN